MTRYMIGRGMDRGREEREVCMRVKPQAPAARGAAGVVFCGISYVKKLPTRLSCRQSDFFAF